AADLYGVRRGTKRRRMPPPPRTRCRASLSGSGNARERCRMTESRSIESVACLGCGCGCDDLTVQVKNSRIVALSPACAVAQAWFGDGWVPDAVTRDGSPVSADQAISDAAATLSGSSGRVLVYIGPEISAQAQRAAVAIADVLRARIDTA